MGETIVDIDIKDKIDAEVFAYERELLSQNKEKIEARRLSIAYEIERAAKNNKIIADFMGWTQSVNRKEGIFVAPKEVRSYIPYEFYSLHTMEYATNWNWLMPVIQKISTKRYRNNCCMIDLHDNKVRLTILTFSPSSALDKTPYMDLEIFESNKVLTIYDSTIDCWYKAALLAIQYLQTGNYCSPDDVVENINQEE